MAAGQLGPRLSRIVLVIIAGVIATGAAVVTEATWGWEGVAPSILVNFGTALVLAGMLYDSQRLFTREVVERTEAAVRAVDARADDRARDFDTRLSDLEAMTSERVRENEAKADATVSALDQVSFGTVTKAMALASRKRAMAYPGRVQVQASDDVEGIWITFSWGSDRQSGQPMGGSELIIEADLEQRPGERGAPVCEIRWMPDQSAPDVGAALKEEIERCGRWEGEGTLDWGLAVRNLRRTIDVAVRSRRRDEGAWHLGGRLFLIVGTDWALTEAGVEAPGHNFIMAGDEFPGASGDRPGLAYRHPGPADWDPPPPPEWANQSEWRFLMKRARSIFPRTPGIFFPTYWVPETTDD